MLFNKRLYYKYIGILENLTIFCFIVYCGIGGLIGAIIYELQGLLIGILVNFISGYIIYLFLRIKVEEMKWKMDIYEKIESNKREN